MSEMRRPAVTTALALVALWLLVTSSASAGTDPSATPAPRLAIRFGRLVDGGGKTI
jgi:hypothetical protein